MSRPFLCATLILALPAVMALAQPKPADSLKPLTVLVIDAETGKPIPAFEYSYRAEGPGGFEAGDWDWTAVRAEDGAVKLELPASCVLNFEARDGKLVAVKQQPEDVFRKWRGKGKLPAGLSVDRYLDMIRK